MFLWLGCSAVACPSQLRVAGGMEASVGQGGSAALRDWWLGSCRAEGAAGSAEELPGSGSSCSALCSQGILRHLPEFPSPSLGWLAERLKNLCLCSVDKGDLCLPQPCSAALSSLRFFHGG